MTTPDFGALTHRDAPWGDLRVLVAGIGVSGFAAADALAQRGARVLVVDAATPAPGTTPYERARILEASAHHYVENWKRYVRELTVID